MMLVILAVLLVDTRVMVVGAFFGNNNSWMGWVVEAGINP
jgi:hypothetical protein